MIATSAFGATANVLNKFLDDTIPKLTCLIAIPSILMLSYIFLIYWHGLHLFVMQMPFPLILPCMALVVVADCIIVEKTGLMRYV
tara:strand:+ start:96 stop:350 length:255 start_codon:yes stop_codon:yes gene_type:complete